MKNKVRNKVLIFMLCLILSGMAMLGCSNGSEEWDEPGLAGVSFGVMDGSEKVIGISREALSYDNLYWSYTAEWKGDAGVTPVGAQSEKKAVKDGAGLVAELVGFTPGSWEFGLFGYSDSERTKLVLSGTSDTADLSAGSTTPVTVVVDYNNTDGTGTIKLGTITFKVGTGYTLESITVDGGTEQITNLSDKQLTGIAAGSHTVYLRYSGNGGYYEAKVLVTVSAGVTTVIAGQLDLLVAAAPTELAGVAPTTAGGSDGTITGLDTGKTYQYSADGGSTWLDVTAGSSEITGLAAGDYSVREKIVRDGDSVTVTVPARYAVTLDKNGGSSDGSATVVHNAESLTGITHAQHAGYTLTGYYTAESGGTKVAEANGTLVSNVSDYTDANGKWIKADGCTLYAQWTANTDTAYKVEHYQQNVTDDNYTLATGDTENKTGTTGEQTAAASKTYEGFTAKEFNQETIAADGSTVVKIYYDRNTYTVTFNANGHGTAPVDRTGVRYEATIDAPTAPTETGYAFGGWYKEAGCTNAWDFGTDTVKDNTTLYAKWVKVYTVSFNANGGEGTMTQGSAEEGKAYTIPSNGFTAPAGTLRSFKNWNTNAAGTGTEYAAGTIPKEDITKDITLYAQWTKPLFSVSATKKVYFSKGNLQYQASSETWKFADKQYDFIGNEAGNNTDESSRATQSDWIDLFGWGTTGYQDTRTSSTGYQTNYQPYSSSNAAVASTAPAYSTNRYGYGPDYDGTNKYGLSVDSKSDWGCIESLPGNSSTTKVWRTLSKDEWDYLLNTRANASNLKKYGVTVCTKPNCLIIAPDNFSGTIADSYDATAWSAAEAAGLVCLPAAGYRFGSGVDSVDSYGNYWSATPNDDIYAGCLYFSSSNAVMSGNGRCSGQSVRLVCGE